MSIKVKRIFTNDNSIYIIDDENNLFVSGNNKNGRLGIDSPLDFVKKITKVEDENILGKVEKVLFDEKVEQNYSLVRLVTNDNRIYIAGTTGDKEYKKWTDSDELYDNIINSKFTRFDDNSQYKHHLEIPVTESLTYLFTIKPESNIYSLRMRVVSVTDIFEDLISCLDKMRDFVFTEYAVTTKKGYQIAIKKLRNGEKRVYLKIIPKDNEFNETNISEILKIDVENVFSEIYYETDEERENTSGEDILDTTFTNHPVNSATFSSDDNKITVDSITDDVFNMISLDVKMDEDSENKLPFTGEIFKDPYWLYTIFKKLGVEPNKLYKFEGSIKRNGIDYAISNVRISDKIDSTPEGADIGIVQFILSKFQKLEEFDIRTGEERISAITFYPVIVDNSINDEYIHYKYHDSISNVNELPLSVLEDADDEEEIQEPSIIYELKGILCGKNLTPVDFSQSFVTE